MGWSEDNPVYTCCGSKKGKPGLLSPYPLAPMANGLLLTCSKFVAWIEEGQRVGLGPEAW